MSSQKRNTGVTKLVRNFCVATSVTDDAIRNFLSAIDTPKSLAVWLLYESGEHDQLLDLDLDLKDYCNAFKFRDDYSAVSLLSKASFLVTSFNKEDRALEKFFRFEARCKATNHRIKNPLADPLFIGHNVYLHNALKRKIEILLGDFSPDEFVDFANWGPGVTTKLSGSHVSASNKFHCENGITSKLYSFVESWFSTAYPIWSQHLSSNFGDEMFDKVGGNKIITVPKNSKENRVIAVEPGINLWFQKAIGKMIRRRLRRAGLDLNTQDKNQQLSKSASIEDDLATIDFSSASDSISYELVKELIPPRWFALMDNTRSPYGVHDEKVIYWEKFSSMGNGFTFELESLIFYAAALVVAEFQYKDEDLSVGFSVFKDSNYNISVFGDDVVIPSKCASLFSSFSDYLGFKINDQKSFSSGYFRESCGDHYFDGVSVKPIYLKDKLSNVFSIYRWANKVRSLAHGRLSMAGCDAKFRGPWCHLLHCLPKSLRLWTSSGKGDSGFAVNFDEAAPFVKRAQYGIEGYYTRSLVEVGVSYPFDGEGLLLSNLHRCITDRAFGNNYTLRGRTKVSIINTLVAQWYNFGPWL